MPPVFHDYGVLCIPYPFTTYDHCALCILIIITIQKGLNELSKTLCSAIGLANFFLEKRLKLHGEVWAKSCLDTKFQPIGTSFDHPSEAPKVPR